MRFLSTPDIDNASAALNAELPDLEVSSLRLGQQGWDNHTFVLNHEWIVRFPKDGRQWRQERWVMDRVQAVSSLPVPKVEFEGADTVFMGYRMLPGIQLSEAWPSMSSVAREKAHDRVVEFFAAMHSSLDVQEGKRYGLTLESTDYPFVRAGSDHVREWWNLAAPALQRVDATTATPCVLHNDLHGDNILVDSVTHEVTGILDFGDTAYGDPSIDLNYLCEFDLHAAERIARRYEAAGGTPVDPQHILDLYFLITLDEYLDPDTPESERAVFRELLTAYAAAFPAT